MPLICFESSHINVSKNIPSGACCFLWFSVLSAPAQPEEPRPIAIRIACPKEIARCVRFGPGSATRAQYTYNDGMAVNSSRNWPPSAPSPSICVYTISSAPGCTPASNGANQYLYEDENGNPVYDWPSSTGFSHIQAARHQTACEIGFMPDSPVHKSAAISAQLASGPPYKEIFTAGLSSKGLQ
jgi:hypothetical protein